MTGQYVGGRKVVATVYDPEADIEHLFTYRSDAVIFHDALKHYNTTAPVVTELE